MENYSVLVIGGGPGGYETAIRLAQLGLSVAVFEKERLGGVCLNKGCIPTKALVKSAELVREIKTSQEYGLPELEISPELAPIIARKDKIVDQLVGGIEFLYRKRNIPIISSAAVSIEKKEDGFTVATADGQSYHAKYVIIATGSTHKSLPGIQIDEVDIMSSTGILSMQDLPQSLAIVGGGVIGCEFASIFRALGVEVSIIEFLPRLVALEDEEVSRRLTTSFKKEKIKIHTGVGVTSIVKNGEMLTLKLSNDKEIEAEKVLLSVGRQPVFDLETKGFELKMERGAILIDDKMQSSQKGIYAIGDVTAKLQLAHTASKQGLFAAQEIAALEGKAEAYDFKLEYINIPRVTFTNPEIGSVGYNEAEAEELFGEIVVGKFPFTASGKALTMSATQGFVKTIARKDTGEIVGMHILGPQAAELIAQGAIMISQKMKAESIEDIVFAHPTLSESIMESVEDLAQISIHKI
ncbi:MAG: dihydrolipoyl dehydrogenase [Candidatus Cloacimonetes bacterium]|nr:dihydrolipoyl dehydrogenase [Candidatus Cloacimonadota bacterium]